MAELKNVLSNCETSKAISSIFKNQDAEVSQRVSKNLYNTDFSQKDTFELKESATATTDTTSTEGTSDTTSTEETSDTK